MAKSIKLKDGVLWDVSGINNNVMMITPADIELSATSWQLKPLTSYVGWDAVGNKFQRLSTGIKVNKPMKKVLASACAKIYNFNASSTDFNFCILKNGVVAYATYETSRTREWLHSTIAGWVIDVQEGDVISLGIISGITGSYRVMEGILTVMELG